MRLVFRVLGGLLLAASPAFGAPNAFIPVTGEDRVVVVDLATNKVVTHIDVGCGPQGITFNRAASKAYVTNVCDGTVSVIRTNDFTVANTVTVGGEPLGVSASASGQVAVATLDGAVNGGPDTLAVIQPAGVAPVTTGNAPSGAAYNPAGDRLYVSNFIDGTVSVVDTARLLAIDRVDVGLNPTGVVMDPSGKRLFVMHQAVGLSGNNMITVLDITGAPRTSAVVALDSTPAWLALHPNGTLLAVAKPFAHAVSIVDLTTAKVLFDFHVPGGMNPSGLQFSADGKKLYVINQGAGGFLMTFDTATWQAVGDPLALGTAPIALGNFIQQAAASYDAPGPLSGLWWNPAESGWGVNFTQRHGNILATWFTYDENGNAKWYAVPNCVMPAGSLSCSGSVYQVTGPKFFAVPAYDPSLRNVTSVGSMSVDFADNDTATMSFTVNGTSRTVAIQREVFETAADAPSGFSAIVDYTDMWWNPQEPGWGMALTQQFQTIFVAWYVYDENGQPDWFVVPSCQVDTVSQEFCGGLLYHTHGPKFGTSFDPTAVVTTLAGVMRIDFTDPGHATFDGVAFGVPVHKQITRQLF